MSQAGPLLAVAPSMAASPDGQGRRQGGVGECRPDTVSAFWAKAWERIRDEHPDVEVRIASLPAAVARLEASAARWAARVVRGEADAIEAEAKIGLS